MVLWYFNVVGKRGVWLSSPPFRCNCRRLHNLGKNSLDKLLSSDGGKIRRAYHMLISPFLAISSVGPMAVRTY